jgi:uncharacterized protein
MALLAGSEKTTATLPVTGLFVYPVKGCAGQAVQMAVVTARGFIDDRLYMIVDDNGKFMTQRELPKMALIAPTVVLARGLIFEAPDMPKLEVPLNVSTQTQTVTIWRDTCQAFDQGEQISNWLSEYLGRPAHLVRLSDDHPRVVDQQFGDPEDHVSFADGYPYLIANEASLKDLNEKLPEAVPMDRFRPNVVLKGEIPWDEDNWTGVKGQYTSFKIVKDCSRCVVITVDQTTAKKGVEPLKTLASFRMKGDNRVIFGQNAVPRVYGSISIGEEVSIER